MFAPHAIYFSKPNELAVTAIQLSDPAKPGARAEVRNFALADVTALETTAATFTPGPPIDPSNPKYRFGIICAIGLDEGQKREDAKAAG